jgi:hypothetical protein
MTATCTKEVVNQFELMSGFNIMEPTNTFWPNPIGIMRCTAAIRLHVTTHVQKTLNDQVQRVTVD